MGTLIKSTWHSIYNNYPGALIHVDCDVAYLASRKLDDYFTDTILKEIKYPFNITKLAAVIPLAKKQILEFPDDVPDSPNINTFPVVWHFNNNY